MANKFGADILLQAPDPPTATAFYVEQFGFEITDPNLEMIALCGNHINGGEWLQSHQGRAGFSPLLRQRPFWADIQPHQLSLGNNSRPRPS